MIVVLIYYIIVYGSESERVGSLRRSCGVLRGRGVVGDCHALRGEQMDIESFYRSMRWESMRSKILRRDGYMCQRCKRYGRMREAKVVHHIKHLDEYPEEALNPNNLISLCVDCHNKAHPEKADAIKQCRGFARY